MKRLRRLFLLFLFLSVSPVVLSAQEVGGTLDQDLDQLEKNLIQLQNDSLQQQILIDNLQMNLNMSEQSLKTQNELLENSQKQLNEALEQYKTVSNSYATLEKKLKNWKLAFWIGVPTSIVLTSTTLLIVNVCKSNH